MFEAFPKIARLNRECVITEKLDGTNAQVWIRDISEIDPNEELHTPYNVAVEKHGTIYIVAAGSRNRWIRRGDDNYGFAAWVCEHAHELVDLGPGRHFGEWWGKGIQRGYGLDEKRFSLFNVHRWTDPASRPACCHVVPTLFEGLFRTIDVEETLEALQVFGSSAAPGFKKPEGIIVYHTAQGHLYKVTCENDESPKSALK